MTTAPIKFWIISLIVLVLLSIFFSLAEAALLSINRYRLKHLVRHHHPLAKLVDKLLDRPDRMLGVILLCDTLADMLAAAIATLLAIHFFGEKSIVWATFCLTLVVLIFGEMAPKTVAALYPQKIAFFAAWPLTILLRLLYPIVWFANVMANGCLRIFGVHVKSRSIEHITHEELRSLLHEAGGRLPVEYQHLLLKVLDLEKADVEEVMVPRGEIVGIDLNEPWETIIQQLQLAPPTRVPLYEESIDHLKGILPIRLVLSRLAEGKLTRQTLLALAEEPYFVPEGTSLNVQLIQFRRQKKRVAFVVNEYGAIQGLLTLEDILEEIVGEFTTEVSTRSKPVLLKQADGNVLAEGRTSVKELNRELNLTLPTEGPRTLSGLITEHLETMPIAGLSLRIQNCVIEVLEVKANRVRRAKLTILPPLSGSQT